MFSITSALDIVTLFRSPVGTPDSDYSSCAAWHCLAVMYSGPSRRGEGGYTCDELITFPVTALLTVACGFHLPWI